MNALESTSGSGRQDVGEGRRSLSGGEGEGNSGSGNKPEQHPEGRQKLNLPPVEYVTTSNGQRMSKYDATRADNIAVNQKCLQELGLGTPPTAKGKKQKKTSKTKKSGMQQSGHSRTSVGSSGNNDIITDMSRSSSSNSIPEVNEAVPRNALDTEHDVQVNGTLKQSEQNSVVEKGDHVTDPQSQ
ncbi:hypothetical protein BDQ17DRAFT_1432818 [Cyathus striatus]|nr:hypothetical protein BDQ17DRAFT_1432818 [Cyathus striatus]